MERPDGNKGTSGMPISRVVMVVGVISITLSISFGVQSQGVSQDCGVDVVELYVEGDPETRALRERSETEFQMKWLARIRCIAEQGDTEAQLKLGIAYRDGSDGPPQDYTEAAKWFHKAAEQENAMAQFNLGLLYENGRGVPQDYVQAHMWYNLAAAGFDWRDESRRRAFERRDGVALRMTSQQIVEAQRLAREWWEKAKK